MKHPIRLVVIATLLALGVAAGGAREKVSLEPIWLDFDMENIKEPLERLTSYYYNFVGAQLIEQWKQALDVPRWVRTATGQNKRARNVNSVDEVPDSSWYTNRHHLRRMSVEELVRGPDRSERPDFGKESVITRAKTGGVTPGLQIKDARGDAYIVKFDNVKYPELQSGAEVIATKILYAAGYNVPENYIAYLHPDQLKISEKVTVPVPGGKPRPFERKDLDEMLQKIAKMPDGSCRVLASKFLSGKPKGPFAQVGIRRDDPNDLIAHEDRRELRGLRVIASWINHWDMKEDNALDMYVEEEGRKFLRHYLIDFGSALGGGQTPEEYFHGREYALDGYEIVKDILTLGFYDRPDEKKGEFISPAMAIFSNADFDPADWKPSFPVMAFDNMTDEDAFWGTRIILSFTEPELKAIIATAKYTNPKDSEYLLKTLLERRSVIARHWLSKVNAIADFSSELRGDQWILRFKDLMVEHGLADGKNAEYIYKIRNGRHALIEKKSTRGETWIAWNRSTPQTTGSNGAVKHSEDALLEVTIETVRSGTGRDTVTVRLYQDATQNRLRIIGIARG